MALDRATTERRSSRLPRNTDFFTPVSGLVTLTPARIPELAQVADRVANERGTTPPL
jgi:hypothetical protein